MRNFRHIKRRGNDEPKRPPRQTTPGDLMDPLLYNGGLNLERYPVLPLEKERKPKEEIENPLNKR